jgi:membrane protein
MILNTAHLEHFFDKFVEDETTTLSASLAFYTALSMAPLLIIFVALTSRVSPSLQETFLLEAQELIGEEGATSLDMIIDAAKARSDLSTIAGWLGAVTLLISASLVFGELRFALNKIFHCRKNENADSSFVSIVFSFLKERLLHIGLTLSFLITMIVSVVAASFKSDYALLNFFVSFIFSNIFFSSIFRFMPYPRTPWLQALLGGIVTAALFVLGKELIGLYLGKSAVGSAYGAAGSVVVLMVWIYYSTLITLVGAQLSAQLSAQLIKPLRKEIHP